MNKTVPIKNRKNMSAYGPLWVQLYEKAFLVSGLKKNRWFTNYVYDDIEGGGSLDVLQWLTGRRSRRVYDQGGSGVVDTLKSNQTGQYLIRQADPTERLGTFLMDLDTFTEHFQTLEVA